MFSIRTNKLNEIKIYYTIIISLAKATEGSFFPLKMYESFNSESCDKSVYSETDLLIIL